MGKTRIAAKIWFRTIAAWVGITYFYYFLTWGTFSRLLAPNALTEFIESGYSHLEILLFGMFFGISFAWIHKLTDRTAMRKKPFGYITVSYTHLTLPTILRV